MSPLTNESLKPVIKRLLNEAWGVTEGEKILVISDYPSAEDFQIKPLILLETMMERNILAKRIRDTIEELVPNKVDLYFMKPTYQHYKNPEDRKLKQKILDSDVVITLTEFSLTDVPIITEPLEEKKLRHISGPQVPPDIFLPEGPLDVDYFKMESITTQLFSLVQGARKIEFFDVAGSHLILEFLHPVDWLWESGFATEKGMFSNLPAGEITLMLPYTQRDCKISGTLNIFPGWQEDLTQLLSLTLKDNRLVDVEGGGKAGEYLQQLIYREEVRIVQVGVGTNPQAKDPLCPTVADKFIGMTHVRLDPDERVEHYYFPISKMKINEKEYSRTELFENRDT
ncbi:MAG: hypothetical protein HGN29_14605 [Asgard group archaeon]|nr:hypothetical protein [Asgard group archaeon]